MLVGLVCPAAIRKAPPPHNLTAAVFEKRAVFLQKCINSLTPPDPKRNRSNFPPPLSKPPQRIKPFRISFRNQNRILISLENIDKSLSDYNLRFSEHPCCKRGCQRILSSQLLVYCRSQYVLLPSYKERNAFLDKQAQFKKDGKKWNNFFLQASEGQHVQVCREAWLLAYGISKGTYKKRSATSQVIGSENKKTKRRREGTLDKEMLFIHWLIRQVQKIGDKLPHGDSRPNVHQIRLPYPNKQVVLFLFSEFSKKQFFVPSNRHCLSYKDATQIWKHHPELQHIKMIRYKGSFSVCKVCLGYELQIKGQLTVAQREEADRNFKAHITETKKERAQYAKDQIKCTEERDKFCIIIDSIDKYKTTFLFFVNAPKSVVDDATLVTTKLTAAMVGSILLRHTY